MGTNRLVGVSICSKDARSLIISGQGQGRRKALRVYGGSGSTSHYAPWCAAKALAFSTQNTCSPQHSHCLTILGRRPYLSLPLAVWRPTSSSLLEIHLSVPSLPQPGPPRSQPLPTQKGDRTVSIRPSQANSPLPWQKDG